MSYTTPPQPVLASRPDPGLMQGVLVGIAAAVFGAAAWAVLSAVTERQFAIAALGLGYGVGYAMVRFGKRSDLSTAVAAGVISFLGVLLGHVASVYVVASREFGISVSDAVSAVPPIDILTDSRLTDVISWLFFLVAPFSAVRLVLGSRQPTAAAPAGGYPPPVTPQYPSAGATYGSDPAPAPSPPAWPPAAPQDALPTPAAPPPDPEQR